MSSRDKPDAAPDFVVPDLDVGPPPSVTPSRAPASRTNSGRHVMEAEQSFELDGIDQGFSLEQVDQVLPSEADGVWPSGRTAPFDTFLPDEEATRKLAAFGAAPTSTLIAPVYAWRVVLRRLALRRELATKELSYQRSERARDSLVEDLVERLWPQLEASERLSRLVEPLQAQRASRKEQELTLEEKNAELERRLSGVEQQLESLFNREKVLMAERLTQEKAGETARLEHGRVMSKHKRIEIEIRNVLDAARKKLGPDGGDMPAAEAARLGQLEAQIAEHKPEVDRVTATLNAARASLGKIDRELETIAKERAQQEKKKRDEYARSSGAVKEQEQGLLEVEDKLLRATRELGCAVLDLRGEIPVPKGLREAIAKADDEVNARFAEREALSAALVSYDPAMFVRGIWVSGLAVAGLVALLLWPLF